MNENHREPPKDNSVKGAPFSADADIFTDSGDGVGEAFTAFSETPASGNVQPDLEPKKKKNTTALIIIAAVLLVALLATSPLLFKTIGDAKINSGDYTGAKTMYSMCLGFYGSRARKCAADAIVTATENNGLEFGIAEALESGVKVHLTYDLNGGRFINSDRQEDILLESSEQFATLYKAAKDNYEFLGWSVYSVSYAPDYDDTVINFNLTAEFQPTVYSISYTNLHSDEQNNPTEYTFETPTITLKNPSRVGYTFISWKGSGIDGEVGTVIIPQGSSGDRAYIANWEANKYTVEFEPDVKCDIDTTMVVTYDDEYTFPAIEKRGYTLKGWSDGKGVYSSGLWSVDSNVTVTPVWELNTYTLAYDLDGGSLSPTPKKTYTVLDEAIDIPDPTRYGYTFLGWTYEGHPTAQKGVTVPAHSVGDFNFKANWVGNKHTLTLNANGGTGAPAYLAVVFGNDYSIPTPTRTGYTFGGWYSGNTQYSKGTWKLDEDVSLAAKWTANQYTVVFDSNGAQSISPMTVTYGSNVELKAPYLYLHEFLGWYVGDTKVDSGTWRIANNVTLTAKWQGEPCTFILDANGGSVSTSKYTTNYGSAYSLPQPTRSGYEFVGWYKNYANFPSSGICYDTGSITLTARWRCIPDSYRVSLYTTSTKYLRSVDVIHGDYYSLPTPTRDGVVFAGWYNGSEYFPASGVWTHEGDVRLTAAWVNESSVGKACNVKLDVNGGQLNRGDREEMTVICGEYYSLPVPQHNIYQNYTFDGWYCYGKEVPTSGIWQYDYDVTLMPKWKRIR